MLAGRPEFQHAVSFEVRGIAEQSAAAKSTVKEGRFADDEGAGPSRAAKVFLALFYSRI